MERMNHTVESLVGAHQTAAERAVAQRYAPVLRFDQGEPFLPLAAGYTLFRQDGASPSFKRRIELAPAGQPAASLAIEYAIWWDWDIQHLYELEHVWVYVDADGQVVRAEASWHGGYHDMAVDGQIPLLAGRVALYSEPGKHAFAPTDAWFHTRWREYRRTPTEGLAGTGGVLVTGLYQGRLEDLRTPQSNTLVRTWLKERAFQPTWEFSHLFQFESTHLVPWSSLEAWIPLRLTWWVERLQTEIPPAAYRFARIGHRGAAAHGPDNSLAAIGKAAELGADMVEIDVQVTEDGHPVVIHDLFVTTADGQVLPVGRSSLAQLRQVDLGDGERIPTLDEVIQRCRAEGLGLYIELKEGRAATAVAAAYGRGELGGWAITASFRPDWVAAVKELAPQAVTSILFSAVSVDPVALAQSVGAAYVHPCWERYPDPSQLLTPTWMARVRAAGLGVICWHEERPAQIAALAQIGVDGICSDAPELLKNTG